MDHSKDGGRGRKRHSACYWLVFTVDLSGSRNKHNGKDSNLAQQRSILYNVGGEMFSNAYRL